MEPLLGRPAIKALQLLGIIERTRTAGIKEECPQVIKGLGEMANVYEIQLHERVSPSPLLHPARPPLPMTEKVQPERKGMQGENIIRSVTTPMDWYAPIVVMPKSSWSVRI